MNQMLEDDEKDLSSQEGDEQVPRRASTQSFMFGEPGEVDDNYFGGGGGGGTTQQRDNELDS